MSRVSETLETIEGLKEAMIGNIKKPELYLLPILSQMALSLAVIADTEQKTFEEWDRRVNDD